MSSATKRKHVTRGVVENFDLPKDDELVVKVVAGRGNNLHEVREHTGQAFLVSMPPKFRKNVWIKRGDFVVVKPIEEGDKVKAEIVTILYKEQIKHIKEQQLWPEGFQQEVVEEAAREVNSEDSEDESDIFQNTNRPIQEEESETSESEED